MNMQVLYSKHYPDGYKRIAAIEVVIHQWGSEELNPDKFGIVILELTKQQIADFWNLNKYCVNETEDGLVETPIEFQLPVEV